MKVVVVGAGLAGLSAAVRLSRAGHDVHVFETRTQPGGMCMDEPYGEIRVHTFGPHVFHTADEEVYEFISGFGEWQDFQHKVVARTSFCDKLLPIPYSLVTEEMIGRRLSDEEIVEWFLAGYSSKMWGQDWDSLPAYVKSRIGKLRRDNRDTGYFSDPHQCLPAVSYEAMFSAMVEEAGTVHLGVEDTEAWRRESCDAVIFTGRLDAAFGYEHGILAFRSMWFMHTLTPIADGLTAPVVNCCDRDSTEIRMSDYKLLTPAVFESDKLSVTVITSEIPADPRTPDEGYYPMPWKCEESLALYKEAVKAAYPKLQCIGRLGGFAHKNMDVVIREGLDAAAVLMGNTSEGAIE